MSEVPRSTGLPLWLNVTAALVLLSCFAFNLVKYGPAGYPIAMIIGGMLGALFGWDQLLKRKSDGGA